MGASGVNGCFWREATFMRNGSSKLANAQIGPGESSRVG